MFDTASTTILIRVFKKSLRARTLKIKQKGVSLYVYLGLTRPSKEGECVS